MRKALILSIFLAVSACSSTSTSNALQILCAADAVAQPLGVTAGQIVAITDPSVASEVSLASQADALAHPAVVAACASVGGKPVSVTPVAPAS